MVKPIVKSSAPNDPSITRNDGSEPIGNQVLGSIYVNIHDVRANCSPRKGKMSEKAKGKPVENEIPNSTSILYGLFDEDSCEDDYVPSRELSACSSSFASDAFLGDDGCSGDDLTVLVENEDVFVDDDYVGNENDVVEDEAQINVELQPEEVQPENNVQVQPEVTAAKGKGIASDIEIDNVVSDYCDSDNFESPEESSDENISKPKKPRYPQFRAKTDLTDVKFSEGLTFATREMFKDAVKEHAVQKGFPVKFDRCDNRRVRARCKDCSFFVYASKMTHSSTWQIKKFTDHNCQRGFVCPLANSTFISKRFLEEFRINPTIPMSSFMEKVRTTLTVGVTNRQGYRARKKALKMIEGNVVEQYAQLGDYLKEIQRSNPGTTTSLDIEMNAGEGGRPVFKRVYICYQACKQGFIDGCRHVIGLDGCFLKGQYKGCLLTAVGVDADNSMWPIAFAVVEAENGDAWYWLAEKPGEEWSRAFFRTDQKCDILLNNFCESFNAAIIKARDQPIINLLERLRLYLMKRMDEKREKMEQYDKGIVCPNIQQILNRLKKEAGFYIPVRSGPRRYQVLGMYGEQNDVNLETNRCSCRRWDLNGIPCAHAIACLYNLGLQAESLVHSCYHKQTYLKAYGHIIYPIRSKDMWPKSGMNDLCPPILKVQPGRPKKVRRKNQEELKGRSQVKRVYGQLQCSICKGFGHNARTCKPTTTEGEPSVQPKQKVAKNKCRNCGAPGHNRKTCRVFGRYNQTGVPREKTSETGLRDEEINVQQVEVTTEAPNVETETEIPGVEERLNVPRSPATPPGLTRGDTSIYGKDKSPSYDYFDSLDDAFLNMIGPESQAIIGTPPTAAVSSSQQDATTPKKIKHYSPTRRSPRFQRSPELVIEGGWTKKKLKIMSQLKRQSNH